MNEETVAIKNLLNFEMQVFKSVFKDVDASEHFNDNGEEVYFSTEDKARAWVIAEANKKNIKESDIVWFKDAGGLNHFNYRLVDHPVQRDDHYFGSYEKIVVR